MVKVRGQSRRKHLTLIFVLILVLTMLAPASIVRADDSSVDGSFGVVNAIVFSDIHVSGITTSAANINWVTNVPATAQVFYDVESRTKVEDYAYRTDEDPTPVIEHTVNLTGLASRARYHFRVRSAVDGIEAVSPDYAFTTLSPTGGGGGGGAPVYYLEVNLWGERFTVPITSAGKVREDLEAMSADELVAISISEGVVALTKDGKRLREIEVWPMEQPPPLPENSYLIGIAYDFTPEDATFDLPIEVEMRYDPSQIPDGTDEQDLVLAYYDEEAGEWVECECTCDPETHCITACICHLTCFAIIGAITPLPSEPVTAPAAFSIGSLNIFPGKVDIGETTTISVLVTNTGGRAGSYEVILKIDGVVEGSREIILNAGASDSVMFSISRDVAGTYSVDINGLSSSFTVREKPAPAKPANWPLIGGIVAAVVIVAGLGVFFWMRRRPSRAYK